MSIKLQHFLNWIKEINKAKFEINRTILTSLYELWADGLTL